MEKERIYREAIEQIAAVLEGEPDPIARMATICGILKHRLSWVSWIGFYRIVGPQLLAIGPYQGPLGCLRIRFDQGVCGAAARTLAPQVVADVQSFPGHIACDPAARSEIVVPVFGEEERLVAVLDLDSRLAGAFDEIDRRALEEIARMAVGAPR